MQPFPPRIQPGLFRILYILVIYIGIPIFSLKIFFSPRIHQQMFQTQLSIDGRNFQPINLYEYINSKWSFCPPSFSYRKRFFIFFPLTYVSQTSLTVWINFKPLSIFIFARDFKTYPSPMCTANYHSK